MNEQNDSKFLILFKNNRNLWYETKYQWSELKVVVQWFIRMWHDKRFQKRKYFEFINNN